MTVNLICPSLAVNAKNKPPKTYARPSDPLLLTILKMLSSPISPGVRPPHHRGRPSLSPSLILISLPPPVLSPPNLTQLLAPSHQISHSPLHSPLPDRTYQQHYHCPKRYPHHKLKPPYHHPPYEVQDLHGN